MKSRTGFLCLCSCRFSRKSYVVALNADIDFPVAFHPASDELAVHGMTRRSILGLVIIFAMVGAFLARRGVSPGPLPDYRRVLLRKDRRILTTRPKSHPGSGRERRIGLLPPGNGGMPRSYHLKGKNLRQPMLRFSSATFSPIPLARSSVSACVRKPEPRSIPRSWRSRWIFWMIPANNCPKTPAFRSPGRRRGMILPPPGRRCSGSIPHYLRHALFLPFLIREK